MLFLKAITTSGETELFNVKNILTIQQQGENLKVLMGAGLYWKVKKDSVEMVNIEVVNFEEIF